MKADFSTRPRDASRRHLPRWLFGAGLLVLAGAGLHAWRATVDRDRARAEARSARADVEAQSRRLRALEGGGSALLRARADLTLRASPPRVIADLAALLPPGARLRQLAIAYGSEAELELNVEARGPAEYDRLLEALVASPRLSSVRPGAESREGEVDAAVRALYRPLEAP
jgi:hypothetical protein